MPLRVVKKITSLPVTVVQAIVGKAVGMMTRPVEAYSPSEATNVRTLKSRLKVGDVLLISGNARISYVVKILTVSQWSHVVIFVGDRRDLLTQEEIDEWCALYGESTLKYLVIDADPVKGVHLKPLDESVGLTIRHCRPSAIRANDLSSVVDMALSQLGKQYDVKHIGRLMMFFAFPWEFLPEFFRRWITDFTLSESDTICSRVISEAFHSVGYPIRPLEISQSRGKFHIRTLGMATGLKSRGKSAARLFSGGRLRAAMSRLTNTRYVEFRLKVTRHITPADYDLSRFFAIIKDKEDLAIDYRNAKLMGREMQG